MTSKEVTSPCSIWDTRATLTPMAAAICFWPRPLLPSRRDRLRDLDRVGQVVLDQGGEPHRVLLGDLDTPCHTVPSPLKAGLNSRNALTLGPRGERGNRRVS